MLNVYICVHTNSTVSMPIFYKLELFYEFDFTMITDLRKQIYFFECIKYVSISVYIGLYM